MRTASLGLLAGLALASGSVAAKNDRIEIIGVAIPGIDFGCDIDGSCPLNDQVQIPMTKYGGGDGEGQMKHFVEDSGLNTFRLPVTWQFLTNERGGADFDEDKFSIYDDIMQTCLATGAYCMIDLHNFGRFDGGIIGQGGPSNAVFAQVWAQLGRKYADDDKVIFGLMNEPHDMDIKLWADSCQAAVTAIRKAGAKSQMILLPGTNFASAATFVSSGSAEALAAVSNPDGSKDGLLLDIHKYLDENNSGTFKVCTTDNVEGFEDIASWLRKNKRQGLISESGASMDPTCMVKFCAQNEFIAQNTDVFVGFVGWGAGSFGFSYILTLTPTGEAGSYEDNKLMKECIIKPFLDGAPKPKTTSKPKPKTTSTKDHKTTKTKSAAEETTTTSEEEETTSASKPKITHQILGEETATKSETDKTEETDDSDNAASVLAGLSIVSGLTVAVAAFALL